MSHLHLRQAQLLRDGALPSKQSPCRARDCFAAETKSVARSDINFLVKVRKVSY